MDIREEGTHYGVPAYHMVAAFGMLGNVLEKLAKGFMIDCVLEVDIFLLPLLIWILVGDLQQCGGRCERIAIQDYDERLTKGTKPTTRPPPMETPFCMNSGRFPALAMIK